MTESELLSIRLHNQLLISSTLTCPAEVVAWLGAMQSQNYEMAKWGIGVRLPGITNKQVEAAVNTGEIIRTHILRPTWHFVVAQDIHWMLQLTAPRIKPAFEGYARMQGVDEKFVRKGMDALPGLIEQYGHLTRLEIGEHLIRSGININEQYSVNYIVSRAELEGIVCSGEVRENKHTYALLHQRVPKATYLSKEEALEKLARKYFASHGPATLEDYTWWSGLTKTDARKGIELIKHDFICEEMGGKSYWMRNDIQTPSLNKLQFHLLPAFDEFVVSYKYREEMIDAAYYRKVLTINGLFSPTIHCNGRITGSWKRVVKGDKIVAEPSFFDTTPKRKQEIGKRTLAAYEAFNK
ncbi:winged helix DNA-binding domain-containing protein [Bacteroides sp. OttesenSCG-928-D19]|nr:winged helix DNA-binding domain-containing protein [Bacteroides sp. OttesenSCG-928-D19]